MIVNAQRVTLNKIGQHIGEVLQGKDRECLKDLRQTDPRDDMHRILDEKGGLLVQAYSWVKDNEHFKRWVDDPDCKLLWISGNAGKGKTMLLCGIIQELEHTHPIHFFFQTTDDRLKTGVSALRGLVFMLIRQHPDLIKHIRAAYDQAGRSLFEDTNSWYALSKIFRRMLDDPILLGCNVIIDAFDECEIDRNKLLKLIVTCASEGQVRWIISSRPWPEIGEQLLSLRPENRLSLELNDSFISAAVNHYITYQVDRLGKKHDFTSEFKTFVFAQLQSRADSTFLWAAMACQHLMNVKSWRVREALDTLPQGIDKLYQRMMTLLLQSDEAELLIQVLAITASTFRPLTTLELAELADLPREVRNSKKQLRNLVEECGSFLVLQNDTIQFVHASAQKYILGHHQQMLFPSGQYALHHDLFKRSMGAMSRLCQDIYKINQPGAHLNEISVPVPDPLASIGYSCVYFLDHLIEILPEMPDQLSDQSLLYGFLVCHYLHWLEAMSLLRNTSRAYIMISALSEALLDEEVRFTGAY